MRSQPVPPSRKPTSGCRNPWRWGKNWMSPARRRSSSTVAAWLDFRLPGLPWKPSKPWWIMISPIRIRQLRDSLLVSSVVGMPLQDGEAAIKLFQQYNARQLVRQSDLAERKKTAGGRASGIAPAVGGTNRKKQLLRSTRLVVFEKGGNLFRRELTASGIQQHQKRPHSSAALLDQFE